MQLVITLIGIKTGNHDIIPGLCVDGTILIISSPYSVQSKYPPKPCITLSWSTVQETVTDLLLSV